MRRTGLLVFGSLLVAYGAHAQSVPSGISQGVTWTPSQWQAAFGNKVDVNNGSLTNPSFNLSGSTRPATSWLGDNQPANRTVFVGGVLGFSELESPSVAAPLIATGKIGLYEHANGMAPLSTTDRSTLLSTWAGAGVNATGGGRGMGEVGCYTTAQPSYAAYFGSAGAYPVEVNMDCITGSGDGSGTYTTSTANGDTTTGTAYTGYVQASDLTTIETAIGVAKAVGTENAAVFFTPNGGGEDLVDAFATGGFWANVRTAIAYGGGVALDTPPAYFLARGAAYQSMVEQMIAWTEAQGYRVTLVVSPYDTGTDSAGNTAGNGYDTNFLNETRQEIAILRKASDLPTSYGVENYSTTGDENEPVDATGNGLINVALFLANVVQAASAGTMTSTGGMSAEAGLQADPTSPSVSARLVQTHLGPITLADVAGAGTLAAQNADNVNIGALSLYGQLSTTGVVASTNVIQTTSQFVLSGGNQAVTIGSNGYGVAIQGASQAAPLTVQGLISPLTTPASSSSACTTGQQEADASYVYVCVATNTWKRAALSSF